MGENKYENVSELIAVFQRFARADWRKKTMWDGLKASEIRMLVSIKQNNDKGWAATTVTEISKILEVTSPTVTQMLNRLIAEGCAIRTADQTDRRITEITLTEKGDRLATKAIDRFHSIFKGIIDELGKEQSDQLILMLNQVFQFLEYANKTDDL